MKAMLCFPLPCPVASGGLWCSIVGRVFSDNGTCVTRAVSGGGFSSVGSFVFFFWLVFWQFAMWLLTWLLLFAQNV
jgi:hypothetical protein